MSSKLVSIIIRSMARPTLIEALDSVARQTYPQIEVVVVNALGSNHPLPDKQCGKFPLRFVDQGHPLDRSIAANTGLEAASGHYLGFLDDDDLLLPEHIAALVAALQQSTSARVAYSGVRMIAYQPDGTPGFQALLNQPFHLPSLRAQNYIPIHAVLFDRTLLNTGCRFDENLALYEDWDFWLQLAQYSEFLHLDQITAEYRNFGHSGFGLYADTAKITAGRAALLDKWRKIWSGAELGEALAALRDGVIHKPPSQPKTDSPRFIGFAKLDESFFQLDNALTQMLDHYQHQRQELHDHQREINALTETTLSLHYDLAEQSRQLEALYRSTSWQITWPLRQLMYAWRWFHSKLP